MNAEELDILTEFAQYCPPALDEIKKKLQKLHWFVCEGGGGAGVGARAKRVTD